MSIKVGINGFGRIGRNVLRSAVQNFGNDIEIVAINDLAAPDANAHLLKYDTNYGAFDGNVEATDDALIVDGERIRSYGERDPADIPWSEHGVEVVLGATE